MNQAPLGLQPVSINAELLRRPFRPPNYEAENQALTALAQTLANAPETILQKLAETALQLCRADTAGISLLDQKDGAEVFRWEALAGVFSDRRNATMPRDASPCGTTIDRNATQLMYMAERVFPALTSVPPVVEALLIPFHVANVPIGTVWVVAHDERRKFDQEDERIIKTLAQLASAYWQLWHARAVALAAVKQERQRAIDMVATNVALQAQLENKTRVEEELQQLNRDLQVRITERAAAMTTGQADEGKNAGIVHDFTNLLSVIHAYAQLIMTHPDESNRVFHDAEVITATIREGVALARQLLEAGREAELKTELGDVNDLLRRMTKILIPMFPTATVAADLDPSVPMIMINAGLINQAVLNLCLNARDAMPDGGKLLLQTRIISGAAVRERFLEASADQYIHISVADTGVGMEPEVKRRVFELYFTTKKHNQGTGLGLSVVRDIIRKHAGFIEVMSEKGCGSTFHIYLPMRTDEAAAADGTLLAEQNGLEVRYPETVLYAEDEPSLALLIQRLLEKEGFKVLTAKDGAEALEVYARHKDEITVAILDSGLAKLNGWEAFRQMRRVNPKLKGILASGYVSATAEARVANGELCGVLPKPYVVEDVLALVKQAIQRQ